MTEDDTIRVLRRISFPEMLRRYHALDDTIWNRMTDREAEEFFKEVGWTEREFRHSWSNFLKNQ